MGHEPPPGDAVVVTETPMPLMSARRFVRGRGVLFEMVRQRYFEVTVLPAQAYASFGDDWHPTEWHGEAVWIWMGERSTTRLPPAAGPMRLVLRVEPALEKGPPVIEVNLNGTVVDTFAATEEMERSWVVPARSSDWNELVLTSDRWVNPLKEDIAPDGRDLSIRLLGYDWVPARP
jgi:hypothetical protein